ncbi:MAG TPA: NfeD family protein [Acidimicrobiia bacterium]|nr:NfeD family protein [Acidimicrobiia bacterium]
MDLGSAETWRWIWVGAVVFFAIGELLAPGTLFLLSFAVGAVAAAILAFAGADIPFQWLAFVVVSAGSLALLVPIGRRLDRTGERQPVGATRWEGRDAVVVEPIAAGLHEAGIVRVDAERWRAESDDAHPIETGATVRVVRVEGTRMVVERTSTPISHPPA